MYQREIHEDPRREDLLSARSWKLQRAAAGFALGVLTAQANAQSAAGSWVAKASLPASLSEVSVVYVAGKVHVFGGSVLGYAGPYHEEYDPATDKWRPRAPVPRSLDHIGATVFNGKIYAFGGFVGGAVHKDGQDTAFEYDPALDSLARSGTDERRRSRLGRGSRARQQNSCAGRP